MDNKRKPEERNLNEFTDNQSSKQRISVQENKEMYNFKSYFGIFYFDLYLWDLGHTNTSRR